VAGLVAQAHPVLVAGEREDDDGDGEQHGDGDDVDEVAGDDRKADDGVVEAAHGVERGVVGQARRAGAPQVLVDEPHAGGATNGLVEEGMLLIHALVVDAPGAGRAGVGSNGVQGDILQIDGRTVGVARDGEEAPVLGRPRRH